MRLRTFEHAGSRELKIKGKQAKISSPEDNVGSLKESIRDL